jgi:hypothetical protein
MSDGMLGASVEVDDTSAQDPAYRPTLHNWRLSVKDMPVACPWGGQIAVSLGQPRRSTKGRLAARTLLGMPAFEAS